MVFLQIDYLDIKRSVPYDVLRNGDTERQGNGMLVSHKAFAIYMGHAGEDTDYWREEAPVDVKAFERTLLTSGTLDALLQSYSRGGAPVATPHLRIQYRPTWRWQEPQPPPPGRPWSEQ